MVKVTEHNYKNNFKFFLSEIKKLNNPSFINCNEWKIAVDDLPLNGVKIPHKINNENDRKLLHDIGQANGLIPLCLNDLIGIDPKITKVYVQTSIGKLYLKKQKFNS